MEKLTTESKFMVAAFRLRSHTVKFYQLLKSYRIGAVVVNTPRALSVGCGLSVKFLRSAEKKVSIILNRNYLSSYIGTFPYTEE
ncbi:MAG: DUF3343 domain-containing protein [Clostridiaceae bacterium]|jgi:hypothetical protein|nr:DUF3343 domain-containing protein [Clostridiaceae bacterium]